MKKTHAGFTLIEVLIVIVMIGILASSLVPKLISVQGRARDTQRKHDIAQLAYGLTLYYNDKGSYPQNIINTGAGGWETSADTGWMASLLGKYLSIPPRDPKNNYNGLFPWTSISITRDASLYVYNNYASGPVWNDLYQCNLPPYALLGATNFEQLPPTMWASCPGYDWSALMDYGYVLAKGAIYTEYSNSNLSTGNSVGTGGTGGLIPVTTDCSQNAAPYAVGDRITCRCLAANIDVNGKVWGTSEYTHNSNLCTAAIHAGVMTTAGGPFTILIVPGRNNYVGSTQNGITSSNKNNAPRGYRLYTYP